MNERRNQQNPGSQNANQRQQGSQQSQGASRQPQQSQGQQGQAGGQSGARQPQQFDSGSRQQGGGSGGEGRLADQIRPHMDVVDQSGALVGTVDHIDGDRIKLTRDSSGSGEHQYLPLSQVAGIESNQIRLRDRGDASFGLSSDN